MKVAIEGAFLGEHEKSVCARGEFAPIKGDNEERRGHASLRSGHCPPPFFSWVSRGFGGWQTSFYVLV